MKTIDQRILIPAAPDAVWEHISNIDNNPGWQANCETISFLSQRRQGVGARWRERTKSRQENVYEITVWYDGLGYEYQFIDGSLFKSGKGRLRLQEIPEGTIVQWTFTYELSGMMSGLRNALGTQRRIEKNMVESLKTLWKQARQSGSFESYQARSLMQDGVQDPDERSRYQSRHTDAVETEQAAESLADKLRDEEPPILDEDTRPSPATAAEEQKDSQPAAPTPTAETDLSRFAPPQENTNPPEPEKHSGTEPALHDDLETFSRLLDDKPSSGQPAAPEPTTKDTIEQPTAPSETNTAQEETTGPKADTFEPKVPAGTDTSEMSIWEVFGIPSPTDSQRMRAIQAAEEAEAEYEAEQQQRPPAAESPTPNKAQHSIGRVGYRIRARRRRVHLRRPGE